MITPAPLRAAAMAAALLLAGCGGSSVSVTPATPPAPPVAQVTRVDLLASSERGIESIAYRDGSAYLGLSNTPGAASQVLRTALPLKAGAAWSEMALGACSVGASGTMPPSAPTLRTLGSTLWLFQPWYDGGADAANEHALCALDAAGSFVPRDAALDVCAGGFCTKLSMSELKQAGKVLYSNAGGAPNLLASSDGGASWRAVLGQLDAMMCYHQKFEVIGERVLVGGECPLDMAYLRAYRLRADGLGLASQEPVSLSVPDLENRNIQFIARAGTTQRVFVGVEGGLLRSEDGGNTFKFVIEHPLAGGSAYPYIGAFLALPDKPDTFVVGGFDKASLKPYLAWSADGGARWTDISALLPGYAGTRPEASAAHVTSIGLDPQGRIVVTVNEETSARGRVLLLTLGQP
ncbi:hypothetical protein HH212_02795 [Massilia forsythiae]|uniref:Exo-alpha-sialidase n=1 Tax=Massilia forsythiae TaxID=2728020 RepID=A0A7Z2ZR53_9BURK|nr:hypothetical protein [Massilia forsythiae]QJD99095.1 hypothetical protein HH212_02795 [Massilia forsythiae]